MNSAAEEGVLNNIIQENQSLEQVNLALLQKINLQENKIASLKEETHQKELKLQQKEEALNKAEMVIRRLQIEADNQKRNIHHNERQMNLLKDQLKNFQVSFTQQERKLTENKKLADAGETIRQEVRDLTDRVAKMRREHLLEMDQQKEKFMELLHKHNDLERKMDSTKNQLAKKEQECTGLQNHCQSKSSQIAHLQEEIQKMIDRLGDIKSTYETELETRQGQLEATRTTALQQLKQMQQTMRQDAVNNQKEIMKLREELKIKDLPLPPKKKEIKSRYRSVTKADGLSANSDSTASLGGGSASKRSASTVKEPSVPEKEMFVNSPLISWLKQQLQAAWLREKELKGAIQKYSDRHLVKLQLHLEDLRKQAACIRPEVEMWQMRNEELETRLSLFGRKLWSLKQICHEQQKQLKRQTVERQALVKELEQYRLISEENVLTCKSHYYDIYEQMQTAENFNKIVRSMEATKKNIEEADTDRYKLVNQLERQVEVSKKAKERISELEEQLHAKGVEATHLVDKLAKQTEDTKTKLWSIFDQVDPATSKALVEPTVEQVFKLVEAKLQAPEDLKHQEKVKELETTLEHERTRHSHAQSKQEQEIRQYRDRITQLECDNKLLSNSFHNSPQLISRLRKQAEGEETVTDGMEGGSEPMEPTSERMDRLEQLEGENQDLVVELERRAAIIDELEERVGGLLRENSDLRDQNQYYGAEEGSATLRGDPALIEREMIPRQDHIRIHSEYEGGTSTERESRNLQPPEAYGQSYSSYPHQANQVHYANQGLPSSGIPPHQQQSDYYEDPNTKIRSNVFLVGRTDVSSGTRTDEGGGTFSRSQDNVASQEFQYATQTNDRPALSSSPTRHLSQQKYEPLRFQERNEFGHRFDQGPHHVTVPGGVNDDPVGFTQSNFSNTHSNVNFATQPLSTNPMGTGPLFQPSMVAPTAPLGTTQISLDQVQSNHTYQRNQAVVIQSVKENIIDAINDLKGREEIWGKLSDDQTKACDTVIKRMVLNAREPDYVGHLYELVKSFFDILRDIQQGQQSKAKKREEDVSDIKEQKTENEMRLVKNVEIVIDVFKKAADKVQRIGEKEWREVIEQQTYVLEELLLIQESISKVVVGNPAQSKQVKQAQTNFGLALSDFQFCLGKALDTLVSKDQQYDYVQTTISHNFVDTLSNGGAKGPQSLTFRGGAQQPPMVSESEVKKQLHQALSFSSDDTAAKEFSKYLAAASLLINLPNQKTKKLSSVLDVKHICNKILRQLREELAGAQTVFVKRLNADLIEFESNQRQQVEEMKAMPTEELVKIVQELKEELLSLRVSEVFLRRCSAQSKATREAVALCQFQLFWDAYEPTLREKDTMAKVTSALEDALEAIGREIRNSFSTTGESSLTRNSFLTELQGLFSEKLIRTNEANHVASIGLA